MPMRLSGLMSGMDTESIIQDLVKAKQAKVDKEKKAQTKHSWKQDAWKELNTKLKNLQSKFVSSMRFSTAYSKKVTKVSDSSAVSVITGEDAVNSVQSLQIESLAKTAYLTGGKMEGGGKDGYTAATKLSEIKDSAGNPVFASGVNGTISVRAGSGMVDIQVTGDTTISDLLTQFKNAGLNANFDAKTQRFFISAKESGLSNDFSITATDAAGSTALRVLGLQTNLGSDKATADMYEKYAKAYVAGDDNQTLENLKDLVNGTIASRTNAYLEQYKSLISSEEEAKKAIQKLEEEFSEKYKNKPLLSSPVQWDDPNQLQAAGEELSGAVEKLATDLGSKDKEVKTLETELANAKKNNSSAEEVKLLEEALAASKKELSELDARKKDTVSLQTQVNALQKYRNEKEKIAGTGGYVTIEEIPPATPDGKTEYKAKAVDTTLGKEVRDDYLQKAAYASTLYKKDTNGAYETNADGSLKLTTDAASAGGATKVSGQDAKITLNGAEFTGNTNTFEINGLTITAQNTTKPGESVTLTTQQDTDGIYDMVKKFLKEYNAVINELDKLYNAASAKGYEPLTSEEKDALSETEVKEYETKIKDALLRRDSNVSSISSALKEVMASGISVNGKDVFLFDFGINNLSYFSAPDNEKNAYHIDGDPDDGDTSGKADKLRGLISSDPDTVISFFMGLSKKLYDKMTDLSTGVKDYRSFGNFYDDKKMKSDYDSYTKKIALLEEKLNAYEDKWYKKFSKMETALAKMQSNVNAVSGLLGG